MRFRLVAVGKPRDASLGAAIREYESRAARYWPLEVVEVRDGSGGADPITVRAREGARLLEHAANSRIVACDEQGTSLTSAQFAELVQRWREAARDVSFVIGGAWGLDEPVRAAAELRLALAPWTLPHELARLVLAEQLYRAGTIVRREPYHK